MTLPHTADLTALTTLFRTAMAGVDLTRDVIALGKKYTPKVERPNAEETLRQHLRLLEAWASQISLSELPEPRRLNRTFVDLDLNITPRRYQANPQQTRDYRVSDLVDMRGHIVLLGQLGAGKTTSLKKVAWTCLSAAPGETTERPIPLLVRLRDASESFDLVQHLLLTLGTYLSLEDKTPASARKELRRQVLARLLNATPFMLLVDGLDETKTSVLDDVVNDLRWLALSMSPGRLLVTSRTGAFPYSLENTRVYEISPLSEPQVRRFAELWVKEGEASAFLQQIGESPYSGAEIRPLTLVHLAMLYNRYHQVPSKPRTVYKKIVRLYVDEWDAQRSVVRSPKYPDFDADRKEDFLQALAYELTCSGARGTVQHSQLREAYLRICEAFDLPESEVDSVANEVETQTGLLIQSGAERYDFAHLALQEYLTAEYIVRMPEPPMASTSPLWMMPDELAVATSLSSRPAGFFGSVAREVYRVLHRNSEPDFFNYIRRFVDRYVRRLMTEKPDFRACAELGAAVAILAWKTEQVDPQRQSLDEALSYLAFADFVDTDVVKASMRLFYELCTVDTSEDDRVIVECDYAYFDAKRLTQPMVDYLESLGYPEQIELDRGLFSPRRFRAS